MESVESGYRPRRLVSMIGRELCVWSFACECPDLSAPSRANIDLNWWHSVKSWNRHGSVNDRQRAGIDLNSMIRRNLRDFDLNSMITQNLRDFVNDMESFNGVLVVPRGANFDNVSDEQNNVVPDINDDHDAPRVGINPDEFTQT